MNPTKPKEIAILGAGSRGEGFAKIIHSFSALGRVVAVAEPREAYRTTLAREYHLPTDRQFPGWQDFCAAPRFCDAVVIATMDQDHVGPALACLELGYDVLLEKPMATTLADCRALEAAQRKSGKLFGVCHSLRYQKGFRTVKERIASGAIGQLITLDLIEEVGWWHQAHSFVRGNWANESRSTFMLLAKSCHDLDYLAYLVAQPCLAVSSFGALTYFRRENAPPGSTERCTDPCPVEASCPYSALQVYVNGKRDQWPANVVSADHSEAAHREAIRTGPYGRCVWKCDNDVVDHQTVNLQFAREITATFTMTAFGVGGRFLRVHGTEGELHFNENQITIQTFADRKQQVIKLEAEPGGHGGGDARVVEEWLQALHSRDDRGLVANAQESLRSHSIVFAAEKSRREQRTVTLAEM